MAPLRRWGVIVERDLLLAGTAAVSILNGTIYSPLFDPVAYLLYLFNRGSAVLGPEALFYLTTVCIAAMTMMVAGIPAALYERLRRLEHSTPASLAIWLLAAALLSYPALARLLGQD